MNPLKELEARMREIWHHPICCGSFATRIAAVP
jgi:hypothetical protein